MDQHGPGQSSSQLPGRARRRPPGLRATSESAKIRPRPHLGEGSPPPCKHSDDQRRGPFLTPLCSIVSIQGAAVFLCPRWQTWADWVNPSRIVVFSLISKINTYYRRCRKIQRTLRSPIVPEAVCVGSAPRPRRLQPSRESSRALRSGPARSLGQHLEHDHSHHLLRSDCAPTWRSSTRGACLAGGSTHRCYFKPGECTARCWAWLLNVVTCYGITLLLS